MYTAWGVYNGIKASAQHVFGSASLKGRRIALQGLGYVSYYLISHLVKEGAQVIGADIDEHAANRCKAEFGIDLVSPTEILSQDCDILSPSAMGAIINQDTIPTLRCKIVAGAANNQLATDQDGIDLMNRGIAYAPDYAINAGGLTNIYHELDGYDADRAWKHVAGIRQTIAEILERADREKQPPHRIADQIAEERVNNAKRR